MSEPPVIPPPVRPVPPPHRPLHPPRAHASPWTEAWSERGTAVQGEAAEQAPGPALAAAPVPGRQGGDDGGEQGGSGQADGGAEELDWRLQQVADAVGMVCRFEQAQSVWSARIPLDAQLLPDTVLHLSYAPGLLALRFETTQCWVRELLKLQLPALQALVAELLPQGCDASVML
ncbi:hypothetical protein GT347_19715 [Xylophilus rhododendri]|uniref:Uncharacterized protein n=1 Tax=Xylophilus rhododendri TaxID=2697032 RepID=A0A857JAK4_9BURK|nr:type III secretion HpaP family protein [Xylophilus rhododendri]QHJ00013.1 hypothetical protein GT347_19715 [Xylophilus rhododendri]